MRTDRRPGPRLPGTHLPGSRLLGPILAVLVLLGCATRPPADDPEAVAEFEQTNDPLEPSNRLWFAVHEAVDQAVLEPVARGYRAAVPEPARIGVRNVLGNFRAPVILLNDLLQGNFARAEVTLGRFMINSTLGLGGILDVAKDLGVPGHGGDFGQTLAVWGLGEGPYLFVPFLGPSNPRDLSGFAVDFVTNPFSYVGQGDIVTGLTWARIGATVVDTREVLLDPIDQVRRTSLDPYATLRSAYRQRRNAELADRRVIGGTVSPSSPGTGYGPGVTQESR
jgi:phospholipid-binding lipoprotein MlaA